MCGIFGIILKPNTPIPSKNLSNLLKSLYTLSESRGKESSGLHLYLPNKGKSWTLKSERSASMLLKSKDFKQVINTSLNETYQYSKRSITEPMVIFGHSRLVTNGTASNHLNNQPVQSGHITVIHNGIVVNDDNIWLEHPNLNRTSQVDTEIMAAMLDFYLKSDFDCSNATKYVFEKIKGSASISWVHDQSESVVLASNTGDIHYFFLPQEQGVIFASERYILEQSIKKIKNNLTSSDKYNSIHTLHAGEGVVYNTQSGIKPKFFSLLKENIIEQAPANSDNRLARSISNRQVFNSQEKICNEKISIITKQYDYSLLKYNKEALKSLKRCSRCILPETFPYINFDDNGVCNYCKNYRPRYANMHQTQTKQEFIDSLKQYKRHNNSPDVLVPFSGGRDSSYGLHLICKEFDLKPITFTYDWGMVTDLARRNIARMCGQLGVQNILVSANINAKRENVRNNIIAWLKKPELGMVPLFMAGDKAFFKIVNQLKKQTGIELNLWCANPLENTDFKSGFCGVSPDFEKIRLDALTFPRKLKMAMYYINQFITNPSYINVSLLDTWKAFVSYYFEPRRDFYFIFDHFIWNENEVNHTLLGEYDWEISPDSTSTWRIGDGTAPFYNYIYNISHGFTEFDTFRSNQIREGVITRETALELVLNENHPREESLRWYLNTINLDFNTVIKKINQLDKLWIHQ
jgi:glucosamine--fructose-6-phosphate aminotransferase (isomerizing)